MDSPSHQTILRASEDFLLERRIATLKHALAVRGGRILSIQRTRANRSSLSERECSANVTYTLDLERASA